MKSLKILFVMRNKLYLRNFESVIRQLADAGHRLEITVTADERKVPDSANALARALEDRYADLWFGTTLERSDIWARLAEDLRALRNFLRYLEPAYAEAELLRERAERRLPWPAALCVRLGLFRWPAFVRLVACASELMERAIPVDRKILKRLQAEAPDVLLVTPLVDLDSEQIDWVKAARKAAIPSGLCVASWDNLTNKGLIQVAPDRIMVWNEFQRREAIEMHGIAERAIAVTGAQLYDHWFERQPTRDRAAFCRELGFDPERPIILYCGSSIFIARHEPEFVARWVDALRASRDQAVATANLLIRPHPMHQVPYDDLDLSHHDRVAIHPRRGGLPVSEDAKADYFDALYHCSAVVGINTSALIEASILNKRCFTLKDTSNRQTQDGTLHYHYLTEGGLVRQGESLEAHIADLSAELSAGSGPREDIRGFVESFVRPHGLDQPGTPLLKQAIEGVAELQPKRLESGGIGLTAIRWSCAPLAALLTLVAMRHDWLFDVIVRLLRRGLIIIANLRRRELVDLVSRPMPLDYEPETISILATSRYEFVTRTRSVMREPWTVRWIERYFEPGDLFFDIGANIGAFSLLCARVHRQRVKVMAFEPGFSSYNALCRNILYNRCSGTVTAVPIALASESAAADFKYRHVDAGATGHALGDRAIGIKKQKEVIPQYEQTMLTMSLDQLLETYRLPVPNHIKVDVDGVEPAVLAGARATLANQEVKSVMVELGEQTDRQAILAILAEAGLTLVREFDKQDSQGSSDAFFAREPASLAEVLATAPETPGPGA